MPRSLCPACEGAVSLPGRPQLGLKVTCPFCGEQLQVVWENPLELDWADYNEEEALPEDSAETSAEE
jgi:uncharacterized paraquat-inducible protein A